MKFFLDANIPYSALAAFEQLDLEAIHARDVRLERATDQEILEHAMKNKSILVTKDLDFANEKIFPSHNGIVFFRLPSTFKASQFIGVLSEFFKTVTLDNLNDAITIVNLGRYRIRKLKERR